ncbi:uncharacterized protein AB675_10397 [Cyphellophora attinorum]|uniref:Uncharacterized protein n=1 Tax=Cyphellophora attinorum TaxID=1664694 RepID=A0A0N0NK40_9EURO|nr:uncharacterized protein AB675_10397 [Phialophora attinorum]KPI37379.1 hypothetical protein AB675_10397 [Phialophora attinorum]
MALHTPMRRRLDLSQNARSPSRYGQSRDARPKPKGLATPAATPALTPSSSISDEDAYMPTTPDFAERRSPVTPTKTTRVPHSILSQDQSNASHVRIGIIPLHEDGRQFHKHLVANPSLIRASEQSDHEFHGDQAPYLLEDDPYECLPMPGAWPISYTTPDMRHYSNAGNSQNSTTGLLGATTTAQPLPQPSEPHRATSNAPMHVSSLGKVISINVLSWLENRRTCSMAAKRNLCGSPVPWTKICLASLLAALEEQDGSNETNETLRHISGSSTFSHVPVTNYDDFLYPRLRCRGSSRSMSLGYFSCGSPR